MYEYVHMSTAAQRSQKSLLDALELELQAVVMYLGLNRGLLQKQYVLLAAEPYL